MEKKMQLYKIPELLRESLDNIFLNEETGEVEGLENYQNIQLESKNKILATSSYIRELSYDVTALSDQIENLKRRKKSLENKQEYLKNVCVSALNALGETRVKDAQITSYISRVESVELDDNAVEKLPPEFVNVKTTKEAKKTELKKAIKNGQIFDGVTLKRTERLFLR